MLRAAVKSEFQAMVDLVAVVVSDWLPTDLPPGSIALAKLQAPEERFGKVAAWRDWSFEMIFLIQVPGPLGSSLTLGTTKTGSRTSRQRALQVSLEAPLCLAAPLAMELAVSQRRCHHL